MILITFIEIAAIFIGFYLAIDFVVPSLCGTRTFKLFRKETYPERLKRRIVDCSDEIRLVEMEEELQVLMNKLKEKLDAIRANGN